MTEETKAQFQAAQVEFYHAGNEESWRAALELFQALEDCPEALPFIEKCENLLAWSVGAHVEFGTFNGKPISWTVVESQAKERLLFCDDLIGPVQYSKTRKNTYWEDSHLRHWLNSEFANTCFSLAERTMMIVSKLKNEENPVCFTQGGPDSSDKIYAWSHQEIVARGFTMDDLRKGETYWVRNPGHTLLAAECVLEDGLLYHLGINSESDGIFVRPVMTIRLR